MEIRVSGESWSFEDLKATRVTIGEGNGNPFQCSCLENPRDGGAWWAAVYGVAQSRTRPKRLSSSSNSSRVTIWSSNPTSGHVSRENPNSKRYMHPKVHCRTIYNSQDMETKMSISTGMAKEDMMRIYNGILLSHELAKWQRICLPMQELQEVGVRSLGWEDPLEKEMATYSSILVWKLPWTEESGGLQFTGSQRFGHN